jgi:hypothetical protein
VAILNFQTESSKQSSKSTSNFELSISKVGQQSFFRLTWPTGQAEVELPYPDRLTALFKNWSTTYKQFNLTKSRGRVAKSGTGEIQSYDWRSKLVSAEQALLQAFWQWLDSRELKPICAEILKAANATTGDLDACINVFITCNDVELERLPWEAWKLDTTFGSLRSIRFARRPPQFVWAEGQIRVGKPRILVILGDETGLSFAAELAALRNITSACEVEIVAWQAGKTRQTMMADIRRSLSSAEGWDILLFSGHSNESEVEQLGGELVIAPNEKVFIQELEVELKQAITQGIQFALFNSCQGLDIARKLVSIGFPEVTLMREPVHNDAAQIFLGAFLQNLVAGEDAHGAVIKASQEFLDKRLDSDHPSVSLVPSVFRARSESFRLRPARSLWQQLVPTRLQAVVLATMGLVSLGLPIQHSLINTRMLLQAQYRQLTQQSAPGNISPILLVQVDDKSIQRDGVRVEPNIDRRYLAQLVNQAAKQKAGVVGIDYLLDWADQQNPDHDRALAKAIQTSVRQNTIVVLPITEYQGEWISSNATILKENESALQQGILRQGSVDLLTNDTSMVVPYLQWAKVYSSPASPKRPSFPYELARVRQAQVRQAQRLMQRSRLSIAQRAHSSGIVEFSYNLRQMWFHPLIDYSLPSDRIYQIQSAHDFLQQSTGDLSARIIIIASGGYKQINKKNELGDNFQAPDAVKFWWGKSAKSEITGGELQAYSTHHLLNDAMITPIPDLVMVLVAGVLAKGLLLATRRSHDLFIPISTGLLFLMVFYGLGCLQIYISYKVLLPWLLPSGTFLSYWFLQRLEKTSHG